MAKPPLIPVIDLFAGPGGLGEGFSAYKDPHGRNPFRIRQSIEKDVYARETLRLRSFFRQFPPGEAPELYYDLLRQEFPLAEFPGRLKDACSSLWDAWIAADSEAIRAEMGASFEVNNGISKKLSKILRDSDGRWVLIGGPPCQAYSVVGRARNSSNDEYRIEDDHRSSLYREYLRVIAEHWPAIFIMENVKGLLSATLHTVPVFEKIMEDLRSPHSAVYPRQKVPTNRRYRIVPIVARRPTGRSLFPAQQPTDFIVECERFGIPQERHRVILVGIREDLGDEELPQLLPVKTPPTVEEVIEGLPPLRSGLSRKRSGDGYIRLIDSQAAWLSTIREQTVRQSPEGERRWLKMLGNGGDQAVHKKILSVVSSLELPEKDRGKEFIACETDLAKDHQLRSWYIDERLKGICNHESRGHMDTDLARYLFAACYAKVHGKSPTLDVFPADLQPDHESAERGIFDDRFRVQISTRPSTTITSHISKDGHYFIHPDPSQCRSLTVREVARLQTFPDNYFFCGPRTAQYVQVGNAVPPLLARSIAEVIWKFLIKTSNAD